MCIWGPNGTIKLSDSVDAAGLVSNPPGKDVGPQLVQGPWGVKSQLFVDLHVFGFCLYTNY